MESLADTGSLKAYLPGLGSSIEWLHACGLSAARLASLFGTNTNHVRQLLYRARHAPFRLYAPGADLPAILARPTAGLRISVKIRPDDEVVLSGSRRNRILELEAQVDAIARESQIRSSPQ